MRKIHEVEPPPQVSGEPVVFIGKLILHRRGLGGYPIMGYKISNYNGMPVFDPGC